MSNEKRGRYLLYKHTGFKHVPYGPRPRKRKCVPSKTNVSKIQFESTFFVIKFYYLIDSSDVG